MGKQRKICIGIGIFLLALCISGCNKSSSENETIEINENEIIEINENEIIEIFESVERADALQSTSVYQVPELWEVMDRITKEQELSKAEDYKSGIDTISRDSIVRLCQSESGRYTAYGFISSEYGKKGILIDYIVDGGSNWNYFFEKWCYGSILPTLEENGEYEVTFTFMQEKNGNEDIKRIVFDTFDTGTMSMREDFE